MKLMVYGAGVLGSTLAHVLIAAGHDVTMLARGARKAELSARGLVIRHHVQRKTTVDRPRVVDRLDDLEHYDAVFAVMQYQQMSAILPDLARADAPLVVLVGNNLSAPEMEAYIAAHSPAPKAVLFAFQTTGGRRENGEVVSVHAGPGRMHVGRANTPPDEAEKTLLERVFQGSKYGLVWQPDMDAWLRSHLAFILPVAYLCYALDCDLKRAGGAQLRRALDASLEGFGLLSALGFPILPEGEELYFEPGPKRRMMLAMLWIAAKTSLGRLAASDHCRSATAEMQALDEAFQAMRGQAPDFPMPEWDALRSAMPGWGALKQKYAK
jgi:2-dehydropantoate 2-reductase